MGRVERTPLNGIAAIESRFKDETCPAAITHVRTERIPVAQTGGVAAALAMVAVKVAVKVAVMVAVMWSVSLPTRVCAQDRVFVVDAFGETEWAHRPADTLASSLPALILEDYRVRGYWSAVVDSVVRGPDAMQRLYVSTGPASKIRSLTVAGLDSVREARASAATQRVREPLPERGAVFDEAQLARSVKSMLETLAQDGYPLAAATVTKRRVDSGDNTHQVDRRVQEPDDSAVWLDVMIAFEPGPTMRLTEVRLATEIRTGPRLVAKLVGLNIGRRVTAFDADEARRRLQATGLFTEVGQVELVSDGSGGGVLTVPLVERPPGRFDIVLGYLSNPDGGGAVVGNGHIVLDNLFGGGRTLSMKLNRPSGRTSTLDAKVEDPFLVGTALGVAAAFLGEQRDSTYSRQSYRLEASYRLSAQFALTTSIRRTVIRPGQVGLQFSGGRQRVPRSGALAAGIGIRYSTVEDPVNPRSGLLVETRYERGTKELTQSEVIGADTVSVGYREKQEQLFATSRYYRSLATRHVVALGADAEAIVSPRYDPADLIRFGGANSLRGYNEQQFAGRFVARGLIEYRYLLDRESFVFAFFDIGYVEVPDLDGPATATTYPGFGFGIQFEAPIGLMTATYALNNEDGPLNGKVHVGLSFAL